MHHTVTGFANYLGSHTKAFSCTITTLIQQYSKKNSKEDDSLAASVPMHGYDQAVKVHSHNTQSQSE